MSEHAWIFCHVRPGFEEDLKLELEYYSKRAGIKSLDFIEFSDTGYLCMKFAKSEASKARCQILWTQLIFARQIMWSSGAVKLPTDGDRVAPLMEAVQQKLLPLSEANAFSAFTFETPDADDLKELSGFCKSLARPTENALNRLKVLPKGKGAAHLPRLHFVMTDSQTVWPCIADVLNSSPWSMGIPRLRFPTNAPSRSTLKLEEAFHVLVGTDFLDQNLKEGMTAVDLGACPGGWTYQLVQRGLKVTAIDNGSMDPALMATGLVTHLREDAFHYEPTRTVDWLVCDVVEQPSLITELMVRWLTKSWCRQAIFNLKLPMKARFKEVIDCNQQLIDLCLKSGCKIELRCKQLFHDRKEVTVYARVLTP